ncbi:MAG: enoyl-CoA hydratase/isomerase family protein [Hydrogenibacillus schlegelii]|uniref:Enoyl-CoA hydratase domain-containing protein 3, mitochondrial n=1 Tax=Hydrogenibacillus schlegelii TaxID=1484 RepID=A0A947GGZ8_HYDSH|nr:enoyl-CoA hydratase/isomerase family protein [Hydrogenibacillus schlegelii]
MAALVHVEKKGPLARVRMDDAGRHNTLTVEMMTELKARLEAIAAARETVVVILEGRENVFSAGHHLGEIQERDLHGVHALFELGYALKRVIREMPQVVLAKVRGLAVAAGLELVAASDLAVAAETARFGTTGIRWGLFCSTPGVFLSRNVPRKKAAEMLFTGRLYSAEEAKAMGLVNEVAPDERLDAVAEELALQVAAHSLDVVELGKRLFYRQYPLDEWTALAYATEVIVRNSKHPDAVAGIQAFLDKRTPAWQDGIERPAPAPK